MKVWTYTLRFFIAVAIAGCFPAVTAAGPIFVELPYDDFGHLWNTDDGTATGNAVGWCAATSIANSFGYLAETFKDVYEDPGLIQGSLRETRDKLNNGWTSPGGVARDGIDGCPGGGEQPMWETKTQWIEDFAPDTTATKGMIGGDQDPSTWERNAGLVHAFPTWDWLWTELNHDEDVELIFRDDADTVIHAVTLIRMAFDDLDGDATLDPLTERPEIGFIDPRDPTRVTPAGLVPSSFAHGPLRFNYFTKGVFKEVFIRSAMSESAVPEPSMFVLFAAGGVALFGYVRKRSREKGAARRIEDRRRSPANLASS